jgi:tRNA(Ile)-lysidine synthase
MSLLKQFRAFIDREKLFSPKDKLLLAVSGGIDSVVLCELCKQAGFDFTIAHCNFKLRGEESERDAAFVQQLALKYAVPFLVKEFNTEEYAVQNKLSIQEAARKLRYEWFETLTPKGVLWTTHLLTAHHLDDNIETMLMYFFRGTGIQGLKGMLPKQGSVIRPLLFAIRAAIKEFAEEQALNWVEDSSNASDKYSRNYIRHQVVPLLQQIYPGVDGNLAENLHRFADTALLYQQAIDHHKKKLLEIKGEEIHIPVLKLQKSIPLYSIVYEIIKDAGFTAQQTGEVIGLLTSESGKYVQSSSHRIIRNRNWLIIAALQSAQAKTILIEEKDTRLSFAQGNLQLAILSAADYTLKTENATACIDAALVSFPLLLRPWKQGDYFYPLGMKKKKKLARFFIDQKLSRTDKEKVWVIEMNKKIVWVVGMRIDDRFKITNATRQVLQLTFS